jgi:hypothetical protein
MTSVSSQMELNQMPNGVYEVAGDLTNVYVVNNGCYFMLMRNYYETIVKTCGVSPVQDIIALKAGGFSVEEIKSLRRDGIV